MIRSSSGQSPPSRRTARCRRSTTAACTCGSRSPSWNISRRNSRTPGCGRTIPPPAPMPARSPPQFPGGSAARGHARAIASEIHGGFGALRNECPMNFWRPVKRRDLSADALADVTRIDAMWSDCLTRYGGPFLFGAFGAADAMYAPVVSRFRTYAVAVGERARAYMNAVMALPAWREWKEAALKEPWVLSFDEPDWPTVLREGGD